MATLTDYSQDENQNFSKYWFILHELEDPMSDGYESIPLPTVPSDKNHQTIFRFNPEDEERCANILLGIFQLFCQVRVAIRDLDMDEEILNAVNNSVVNFGSIVYFNFGRGYIWSKFTGNPLLNDLITREEYKKIQDPPVLMTSLTTAAIIAISKELWSIVSTIH